MKKSGSVSNIPKNYQEVEKLQEKNNKVFAEMNARGETPFSDDVEIEAQLVSSVIPLHHAPIYNTFSNISFIFFLWICDATA